MKHSLCSIIFYNVFQRKSLILQNILPQYIQTYERIKTDDLRRFYPSNRQQNSHLCRNINCFAKVVTIELEISLTVCMNMCTSCVTYHI